MVEDPRMIRSDSDLTEFVHDIRQELPYGGEEVNGFVCHKFMSLSNNKQIPLVLHYGVGRNMRPR